MLRPPATIARWLLASPGINSGPTLTSKDSLLVLAKRKTSLPGSFATHRWRLQYQLPAATRTNLRPSKRSVARRLRLARRKLHSRPPYRSTISEVLSSERMLRWIYGVQSDDSQTTPDSNMYQNYLCISVSLSSVFHSRVLDFTPAPFFCSLYVASMSLSAEDQSVESVEHLEQFLRRTADTVRKTKTSCQFAPAENRS
jgi:hypothetical protein